MTPTGDNYEGEFRVRAPKEYTDAIKLLAARHRETRSVIVRRAVREFLEREGALPVADPPIPPVDRKSAEAGETAAKATKGTARKGRKTK